MDQIVTGVVFPLLESMLGFSVDLITDNLGGIKLECELTMLNIGYKALYEDSEHNVIPKCIGRIPDDMTIEFIITAYNSKKHTSGMSDCRVLLEYSDGNKVEIGNLFSCEDDVNELENLLNIESKTTVKVRYRQREIFWNPERLRSGFKVYLEYRISGKKKVSTPLKIYEIKSLEF